MRRKDIVENPLKSFQQGVAKGFQSTQKGKGVLGPDSFERGIKAFFTNVDKDDKKLDNKKEKPSKPGGKGTEKLKTSKTDNKKLDPKKSVPTGAQFIDGRVEWKYDDKKGVWISNRKDTMQGVAGILAYNKAPENKRQYVVKEETMSSSIKEGLADLADMAERDHEVQMARADLYKIAKYAIKLHDMMKNITEADGLEGWQQAKITKAADYIGSVYHNLDYDLKFSEDVTEARDTHCSDKCCGSDVKREDCKCPPDCKGCNCNAVTEAKENATCGCGPECDHCGGKHSMKEVGKTCECCGNKIKLVTAEGKGKLKKGHPNYKKQAAAIAISKKANEDSYKESLADKLTSKLKEAKGTCKDCGKPSYTTLPEEKQKGVDGKVCWKGYKRMGTKKKGGKTVDNCVKM